MNISLNSEQIKDRLRQVAFGKLQTPGLVAANLILYAIWFSIYTLMFYKANKSKTRTYAQKLGLLIICELLVGTSIYLVMLCMGYWNPVEFLWYGDESRVLLNLSFIVLAITMGTVDFLTLHRFRRVLSLPTRKTRIAKIVTVTLVILGIIIRVIYSSTTNTVVIKGTTIDLILKIIDVGIGIFILPLWTVFLEAFCVIKMINTVLMQAAAMPDASFDESKRSAIKYKLYGNVILLLLIDIFAIIGFLSFQMGLIENPGVFYLLQSFICGHILMTLRCLEVLKNAAKNIEEIEKDSKTGTIKGDNNSKGSHSQT